MEKSGGFPGCDFAQKQEVMNNREASQRVTNHFRNVLNLQMVNGYFSAPEQNLLNPFSNWNQIENEIRAAGGQELKPRGAAPPKFCACYSSSALCVNHFAPIHENPGLFSLLNHDGFEAAQFEKVIQTGVPKGDPNLDFYLESKDVVVGIESKMLEFLNLKLPDQKNSLGKYVARPEYLRYLPSGYLDILEFYRKESKQLNLDVSQLLKHGMALIKLGKDLGKHPVLVYLYWLPTNWFQFQVYHSHLAEIQEFKVFVSPFIEFHALSYLDLWTHYQSDPSFGGHFLQVRGRYEFSI